MSAYTDRAAREDEEDRLQRATDDFLSTEFGSWAGEFSAGGKVVADIAEKRVYTKDSYYEVPTQVAGEGDLSVQF
jgi:hypothetical protein